MSSADSTATCTWCRGPIAQRKGRGRLYCQPVCRWASTRLETLRAGHRRVGVDLRVGWLSENDPTEMGAFYASVKNDPCAYCGSPNGGTFDHIVPSSFGGENNPANITGSCQSCNSSKQQRPLLFHLLMKRVEAEMAPALDEWDLLRSAVGYQPGKGIARLRKMRVRDKRRVAA